MGFFNLFRRKKKEEEEQNTKESVDDLTISVTSADALYDRDLSKLNLNAEMVKQWNCDNALQRVAPITSNGGDGFAMDSGLKSVNFNAGANPFVLNHFISNCSFIGYQAMAVMSQHWLISKGCFLKGRDALKRGYKLTINTGEQLEPNELELINSLDRDLDINKNLSDALGYCNVFGIRHILFKHKDKNFDYSKPFNPDAFKGGDYAGIVQIDPQFLAPEFINEDLSDPLSGNFYNPEYWNVFGKRVHKSHMVILTGEEVPKMLKPTYRYGGISLVQRVYERVYCTDRVANESPKLMLTKRTNVRKMDLTSAFANPAKLSSSMNSISKYKDNHGVLLADKEEEIQQLDTNLTGIDEVITSQYEIVASILDIPVSKLLGTGHKGLSTGETDEDYYISSLQAIQENEYSKLLKAHYLRLSYSLFDEDKKLTPVWLPMKVTSDHEKASTNNLTAQMLVSLYNVGSIDSKEIRDYIATTEEFGLNNLDLSKELLDTYPVDYLNDDVDDDDDDPEPEPEKAAQGNG